MIPPVHLNHPRPPAIAIAACLVLALATPLARAVEVYVGGGRAYPSMTNGANDSAWSYVRTTANGWYLNNFNLNGKDGSAGVNYCAAMAAKFSQKNAFYETDFLDNSDGEDKANIDEIRGGGWLVKYCTVNRGYSPERKYALRWRDDTRPVMFMVPPWQVGGNFYDASYGVNASSQSNIRNCNGSTEDGPMTLWADNTGYYRTRPTSVSGGSATLVQWTRGQNANFQTMVMMAPNESTGAEFLSRVKDCVRMHERSDVNAQPKLYVLSFYGPARFDNCPVLPESSGGQPANTFMGAAFWVIHHVKDPAGWARLEIPSGEPRLDLGNVQHVQVAAKAGASTTVRVDVANHSTWMDLVPVVGATISDPDHAWNVSVRLANADVTRAAVRRELAFTRDDLRLWPGDRRTLEVTFSLKSGAPASARPVDVALDLMPHPASRDIVNQTLRLRAATTSPESVAQTAR